MTEESKRSLEAIRVGRRAALDRWRMLRGGRKAREALDMLIALDVEYHKKIAKGEDRGSETEEVEEA